VYTLVPRITTSITKEIGTYLDFDCKSSEIEIKIAKAARLDQQRKLKFITLTDPGKDYRFWLALNGKPVLFWKGISGLKCPCFLFYVC